MCVFKPFQVLKLQAAIKYAEDDLPNAKVQRSLICMHSLNSPPDSSGTVSL